MTLTKFEAFSRQLLKFKTFSGLYEPCCKYVPRFQGYIKANSQGSQLTTQPNEIAQFAVQTFIGI